MAEVTYGERKGYPTYHILGVRTEVYEQISHDMYGEEQTVYLVLYTHTNAKRETEYFKTAHEAFLFAASKNVSMANFLGRGDKATSLRQLIAAPSLE